MSDIHSGGRPNAMAVRADDLTLGNFPLRLPDALCVANVQRFASPDVIELQGDRVRAVAAICAPVPKLVVVQPIANRRDRLWFVAHPERNEQPRQEPRSGSIGRVGREQQLLPWEGGWQSALTRLRAVDHGVPRSVAATDAARNAIVPQVAAEVIGAYLDVERAAA
jgi:hypothetical protein